MSKEEGVGGAGSDLEAAAAAAEDVGGQVGRSFCSSNFILR